MEALREGRTAEVVAAEIRALTASMLSNVIEIGRRMCEVKEMLPHGAFGAWIEEETGYSRSTATNFMRLFQEYGAEQGCLFGAEVKCQSIGNLSYSKALALLALPAGERESFVQETHLVDGKKKSVEEMSNKELQKAIREKKAAEERITALESELSAQKAVAEELKGLQRELELAKGDAADKADKLAEAAQAADALMRELEELKAAPVEVAIEVDREAVEKARVEAAAEMKAKVEKAKEQADKAREKQRAAEEALKQANARLAEIARVEKRTEIASDRDFVLFEALFTQGQEVANKLRDILMKVKEREESAPADKLSRAMIELAEAIRKAAQL